MAAILHEVGLVGFALRFADANIRANMLARGCDHPNKLEQAVRYLRIAAGGGSRLALLTLGDIYAADGFSGLYDLDQVAQAYTILGDQNKLDMVKHKGARDVTNAEIVRLADERRERYLAELRNAHAYDKGWASRSFNWKGQPPLAPLARQPSELAQYTAISNHYNQISCNAGWSRC